MGIFKRPALAGKTRKRDVPEGLWQKCPACGEVVHNVELAANLQVCPRCDHHFPLSGRARLDLLLDPGSFAERDADMAPVDRLAFKGPSSYRERLATYQRRTGLRDAVLTGTGRLEERPLAIAALDFNFIAATMGAVVGERLARLVEHATAARLPVVIVSASGGARMYEGVLSLMQMAKTCGALAAHSRAGLPYLSVLTHPTTGGVSASFATIGDVIIAEPRAMIGFAGPRVIKETTHQELPPGFQTAEFLRDRGLIDLIVHRRKLRASLANLLAYLTPEP